MALDTQRLIQDYRRRYDALSQRERWMVLGGGIALALTVLYAGIYEPLSSSAKRRSENLAAARDIATQLEAAAMLTQQRSGSDGAAANAGMSLLAAVDQSTREGGPGKPPSRIQPDGERVVRVSFEDVSFDSLVRWLGKLQTQYGIRVQSFDVEAKDSPGSVDARLALVRS